LSEGHVARVGSVVLDCHDSELMVSFWGRLLGLEEKGRSPGFVWMGRLSDGGPSLSFQQVPEEKVVKNRMHLDLDVEDREDFVANAESLGGSRLADHQMEGFHWTVMADPEGNEFCVVAD
jgi:predicted enzyme related to lactoylglutathione lyase